MPRNIQIDSKGNLYIANFAPALSFDSTDEDNGRWWLSRITPGGVSAPNWAQVGAAPNMIVFDPLENIFTVNELSYSVTKTTPDGVSNIMWGLTDETIPGSLTIDSKGNIYTGNYFGSNVSKITASGVSTKNWAPAGLNPDAITVDANDNIYVTNQGSDNISKITPDGKSTVNWGPGGAEVKTGRKPYMVVFDSAGNLYSVNYISQNVSKIKPDGTSTVYWGPGGAEVKTLGIKPITITIDSAGNLYTGDHGSDNVTKITPDGVATLLVDLGNTPLVPPATAAYAPRGITIDSKGNLYTANQTAENVSKISPTVTNGTPDIFPAPPARPSAPTATADTLGPGTATVSVTANPVSAAYGAPTSYTITATQDASKQCVVTSPATSCIFTGLTVGTGYTFAARANLNTWQTAPSAASNSVGALVVPKPATPTKIRWNTGTRTTNKPITASFTAAPDTTYTITATRNATRHLQTRATRTARGTCNITTDKKTQNRTATCTIRLKQGGAWLVNITPNQSGIAGTPATKTIKISTPRPAATKNPTEPVTG
jgi:sugar lactone lactonase YvrE